MDFLTTPEKTLPNGPQERPHDGQSDGGAGTGLEKAIGGFKPHPDRFVTFTEPLWAGQTN